jgi:hypothetical protein
MRLTLPVSLPGLTGQSSIPGLWLLDRPVKPGDDTKMDVMRIGKCSKVAIMAAFSFKNVRPIWEVRDENVSTRDHAVFRDGAGRIVAGGGAQA